MRVVVTGSAGHLGEALTHTLVGQGHDVVGLDILRGVSITDRAAVRRNMVGVDAVVHSATLHKPHIVSHERQQFVDTNVTGTLILLEEAVRAGVQSFVYTSTTSVFGDALVPPPGQPAAWITEDVVPVPKNIYGVTKRAAEDLCEIFHRNERLACIVLRTSRFFPEEDDDPVVSAQYANDNLKVNELLYRRVDLEDVVSAHLAAVQRAPAIGFGRYIVSATTPFTSTDLAALRVDTPSVVRRYVPEYEAEYAARGWKMLPGIDRVYVNERARRELGWEPRHDFRAAVDRLRAGDDVRSPIARLVGSKGYHAV